MKKSILLLTLLTSFASFGHSTDTIEKQSNLLIEKIEQVLTEAKVQDFITTLTHNHFENLSHHIVSKIVSEIQIFESLKKGADQGNAENQYRLGLFGVDNLKSTKENKAEVFELMKQAADQGHVEAHLFLSAFYQNGFGVEQDLDKALYWHKKYVIENKKRR